MGPPAADFVLKMERKNALFNSQIHESWTAQEVDDLVAALVKIEGCVFYGRIFISHGRIFISQCIICSFLSTSSLFLIEEPSFMYQIHSHYGLAEAGAVAEAEGTTNARL